MLPSLCARTSSSSDEERRRGHGADAGRLRGRDRSRTYSQETVEELARMRPPVINALTDRTTRARRSPTY